ncbi:MAG: hypothetical protein KJ592_00095 [Nanoarchaeota archaeon]|nr:hypothetical protein [Nanoarchaeota archaeon]
MHTHVWNINVSVGKKLGRGLRNLFLWLMSLAILIKFCISNVFNDAKA